MAITWGDIKNIALQRIYSYSKKGTLISADDGNQKDYLYMLPAAGDAAQMDIIKYRPIIKKYTVTQTKPEMDSASSFATIHHYNEDLTYEFESGKGYYFEVNNPGTIYIESIGGDTIYTTITVTTVNKFVAYKGVRDGFQIRFSGDYPYDIRYLGAHLYTYNTNPPIYRPYNEYDIKTLVKADTVEKFARFANRVLAYEGDFDAGLAYIEGHRNFVSQDGHTIRIAWDAEGQFDIYYVERPTQITSLTADATVPDLWEDTLLLMPLYMAYVAYLDDDPAIATMIYNEYVTKLRESVPRIPTGETAFIIRTGWSD